MLSKLAFTEARGFEFLSDLRHEEFWVLLLRRNSTVIAKRRISQGGTSGTVVDPHIVFKMALEHHASALVLCHNHPSGEARPSPIDVQLTKRLKEAGTLLDITVIDHLIIAEKTYYSFSDEGML